jgi:hypothetical protein
MAGDCPAARVGNPVGSGAGNNSKTGPGGGGFPLPPARPIASLAMAVSRPAGQLQTGKCPSGQVRAMFPAQPAARTPPAPAGPGGATRPGAPRRTRPVASYPASGAAFPRAFRGWPAQRDQAAVPVGRPANRPLIPLRTAGDSTGLSADTSRYRGLSRARNGFRRPVNHTGTARRSRHGRDHARRTCRAAPATGPGQPGSGPVPSLFPGLPAAPASRAPACGPT